LQFASSTSRLNEIRCKGEITLTPRTKTLIAFVVLTATPLSARTKKGDEYFNEGARAELRRDYDTACQLYNYALAEDPREPSYIAADQHARRLATEQILAQGRELVQAKKMRRAMELFQTALRLDPQSQTAQEEIRKIEKQVNALPLPVVLDPPNDPIGHVGPFRSSRSAYESIAKLAGIKVVFDLPEAASQDRQFGDMSGVSVEDALNNVARNTHTFWKAINSTTIYVTRASEQQQLTVEAAKQVSLSFTNPALVPEDALRAASRTGKLADVVRLVLKGTDVNARDALGMTPLLFAVTGDDPEIVRFLLDHGANANARLSVSGQSVLHVAVSHGNPQIVQLVLSAHPDLEALDVNGNTPLDTAVFNGREEIVRLLLAHGANIKGTHGPEGRSLLHEACAKGSANLIPLLVEFGADPTQQDQIGETPLDLALAFMNENAVAALLKLTAQHKQLQVTAQQAMENATVRGFTETARLLLENGLDANQPTAQGSTYLGDAALKGQTKMVQLLLDHGANIKVRNKFGGTVLHDAALGGNVTVIDLLLDRGAEIDARNLETGATPLMEATSLGRVEAVAALLKHDASAQLRDSAGHTALDRARETENTEIIRLLAAPHF
jgi:ankyrin repeat protein